MFQEEETKLRLQINDQRDKFRLNFSKHTNQRSSNAQNKIKIYLYSTYQQHMHSNATETVLFLFLYYLWSL